MGRGKALSAEDIAVISAMYHALKEEIPAGAKIGPDRLMAKLPPHIKRTALQKVLTSLKNGNAAQQIVDGQKQSRQWPENKKKVNAKNAGVVKKIMETSNSTLRSSARLIAQKLKMSHVAVAKIVKDKLGLRALKHVKTTHSALKKTQKRHAAAQEIMRMYAAGMRTTDIWFTGETWAGQDSCARYNPKNERFYYPKEIKKDSVIEELCKPQRQRAPGIMAHFTVSAANGGALLKPHFAPHGQTMTGEYYVGMLEPDTFRQIDAATPEGAQRLFQQDLASAHTSKVAKALLRKENVRTIPRMPSGADLNQLGVFVNPSLKKRLQGKDHSAMAKLKHVTAVELRNMSARPRFRTRLEKARLSFRKRARFVAENGGRKVSRSLLKRRIASREAAKEAGKLAGQA